MSTTTPIHVAVIAGHPLRLFLPLDGPDPWHAVNDLHRCLGVDPGAGKALVRGLMDEVPTVVTPDEIVMVGPHEMAQGTIDVLVRAGFAPATALADYEAAAAAALKKLTALCGRPIEVRRYRRPAR